MTEHEGDPRAANNDGSGTGVAPLEKVAGYTSPYPYAPRLQDRMDEIIDRKVPNAGTFCGFCFARLAAGAERCPYCGTETAPCAAAGTVPREVLRAYGAKKRTEATWVYSGALLGLMIAAALFVVLVVWAPGLLGHPGIAFLVLIGGGYVLAQIFGPLLAGQLGYRVGSRKRDRLWRRFLEAQEGERTP